MAEKKNKKKTSKKDTPENADRVIDVSEEDLERLSIGDLEPGISPNPWSRAASGAPAAPDPWARAASGGPAAPDPWARAASGGPAAPDPWARAASGGPAAPDPWARAASGGPAAPDPWARAASGGLAAPDPWARAASGGPAAPDPWARAASEDNRSQPLDMNRYIVIQTEVGAVKLDTYSGNSWKLHSLQKETFWRRIRHE